MIKTPFIKWLDKLWSLCPPTFCSFQSYFKRLCCLHKMTVQERERARRSERHKGLQQTHNSLDGWWWASRWTGKLELNKHAPHDYNEPERAWSHSARQHSRLNLISCAVVCVNIYCIVKPLFMIAPSTLAVKQRSLKGAVSICDSTADGRHLLGYCFLSFTYTN